MLKNPVLHHVEVCESCGGTGEMMGAAMRIYCNKCEGTGFVSPGHPVLQKAQVCRELYRALKTLEQVRRTQCDTAGVYVQNTRGAGRSNYVGD